jgi:hypothetical protein
VTLCERDEAHQKRKYAHVQSNCSIRYLVMGRIEKTVFISYRRTDEPWALAVFQNLTQHGYDVFIDFEGIASGDFETVILENIRARAHFLVLLTPTALERCLDPEDWMRREIEAALESRRNIVPLLLEGFDFSTPPIPGLLTGKLAALKQYNGLPVPKGYFPEAMERLRDKFLSVSVDTVLQPASPSARQAAAEQKGKAVMALAGEVEQFDSVARAEPTSQAQREKGAKEGTRVWRVWLLAAGVAGVLAAVVAAAWIARLPRPQSYTKIACTGEYERNCPGSHDLFYECDYFGPDDKIASQVCRGATSKAVRLKTVSGNRCGYSLIEITCN